MPHRVLLLSMKILNGIWVTVLEICLWIYLCNSLSHLCMITLKTVYIRVTVYHNTCPIPHKNPQYCTHTHSYLRACAIRRSSWFCCLRRSSLVRMLASSLRVCVVSCVCWLSRTRWPPIKKSSIAQANSTNATQRQDVVHNRMLSLFPI